MTDEAAYVRCTFHARIPVEGGHAYEPITPRGNSASGSWSTLHPPSIGDLVPLSPQLYKVTDRIWRYAEHGSRDWPLVEPHAIKGPMLDLIVEPAQGPYHDQIVIPEEDDSTDPDA
jgi:hypothetical protein